MASWLHDSLHYDYDYYCACYVWARIDLNDTQT
jgi:hypothetical protein